MADLHQDHHLGLVEAVAGIRPINATEIEISDLDMESCPYQLRDDSDAPDLTTSLEQFGQIVPILVMPGEGGYVILDGHCRVVTAKVLGWTAVNAMVYPNMDPEEARRVASICNLQRKNLTPAELANAVHMLRRQSESRGEKITNAKIAKTLGLNSGKVVQRLMTIPEVVLPFIDSNAVHMAHAFEIGRHVKTLGLAGESLAAEVGKIVEIIQLKELASAQLRRELVQRRSRRGGKKKKCYCWLRDDSLHLSRCKLSGTSSAEDLSRARAQLLEGAVHLGRILEQLEGDA